MNYEPWIWVELLGFDNTQSDMGVSDYLAKTQFIPKGICLFLSSPDFVLQHRNMEKEVILPPTVCAREGNPGNEERARQEWTNWQVKTLVGNLRKAGTEVYIALDTVYGQNKFHTEWLSEHPECLQVWDFQGPGLNVNCLSRMKDGTYFEDYFIPQLLETINDYGFDGWHGLDGWCPLTTGCLRYTDCSDDMMGQFAEYIKLDLPEIVICDSANEIKVLEERMDYIWANLRKEWIAFWSDRSASFWEKTVDALHKNNSKALINSAWTKACFEAEYRYGIDYKRIMETKVDYMVVETVAAGVALSGGSDSDLHYKFLAMFMEIKAYAPDMKLISLHGVKDVVENWDLLRHGPTLLQREFYSLANVYYGGKRVSDGFLVCLGDGIKREEWEMLRNLWNFSFDGESSKQGNVTVIWSDDAHSKLLDDYLQHGTWNTAQQMQYLLERGVQIQNIDRIENLDNVSGTIFVANSHLLPPVELQKIKDYRNGEVITTERGTDKYTSRTLNKDISSSPCSFKDKKLALSFFAPMSYCTINDEFWDKTADVMNALDSLVSTDNKNVSFMTQIIDENTFILTVKNNIFTYLRPKIDFIKGIKELQVTSGFPYTNPDFSGNSFTLTRLPPKGVVTLKVSLVKS